MRPFLRPDVQHFYQVLHSSSNSSKARHIRKVFELSYHVTSSARRWSTSSNPWTEDENKRIYIYGSGNAGRLFAHALAQMRNPPPITFLVHSNDRVREFNKANRQVTMIMDGVSSVSEGFDIEVITGPGHSTTKTIAPGAKFIQLNSVRLSPAPSPRTEFKHTSNSAAAPNLQSLPLNYLSKSKAPKLKLKRLTPAPRKPEIEVVDLATTSHYPRIKNLIFPTKAHYVVEELTRIKERLRRDSTVLFVQNGMGVLERVNHEVFPKPETRPNYLIGLSSHCVWETQKKTARKDYLKNVLSQDLGQVIEVGTFSSSRSSLGSVLISPVIHVPGQETAEQIRRREQSASYLLGTIKAAPVLEASSVDRKSLLFYRLRRLAINSVIHPMTAILECKNGEVLKDTTREAIAKGLLEEASMVVSSDAPDLTRSHLEKYLAESVLETQESVSSMLTDVMAGRMPEIDGINGWLVDRGKELGIPCPRHEQIITLIKQKVVAQALNEQDKQVKDSQNAKEKDQTKNVESRQEKMRERAERKDSERPLPIPPWDRPLIRKLGSTPKVSVRWTSVGGTDAESPALGTQVQG